MDEWISVEEMQPGKAPRLYRVTVQVGDGKPWVDMCLWDGARFCVAAPSIVTAWWPERGPVPPPRAPEEPEVGGWISVKDRLPIEGLSVLVGWTGSTDCAIALRNRGEWTSHWNDTCFSGGEEPPTHWQVLPAPPRGTAIPDTFAVKRFEGSRPWGSRANSGIYHVGTGWLVWNFVEEWAARGVCSILNKLWRQDKGSTEETP